MDSTHSFARDELAPSWWANRIQNAISLLASNFRLTQLDSTTLRVPASAGAAAVIVVRGLWRWSEAHVDRAHPGGPAGTYDVFVTAKAQSVDDTPAVATDHSDYSFALAIVAAGATPPIVAGTVDVFRKVGTCQWSGTAITQVDPIVETPWDAEPSDGPAGQATRRTLGTGARQAAAGNDARLSDSRAPNGLAGGDLAGNYPAPTIKNNVALGGVPTAATASPDAATTQLATTAFVLGQAASAVPLADAGGGAAGSSPRYARGDHTHPTDASRAPLASPTFTGIPAAATPVVDTNTTQLATTAYVVGQGYAKLASPSLTGTPTSTTPGLDDGSTRIATTAYVLGQLSAAADGTPAMDGTASRGASLHIARADHVHPTDTSRAPLASPAFSGTPTAATATPATATTQIATTAFVTAAVAAVGAAPTPYGGIPTMNGTGAAGSSALYARGDHVHPSDTSRAPLASPAFTGVVTVAGHQLSDQSVALYTPDNFRAGGYLEAMGDSWVHGILRLAASGYSTLDLYNWQGHVRAGGPVIADGYLQSGSHIYLHGTQLFFGSAEDAYIERQAANLLRTSGGFAVGGASVPIAGTHIEMSHNGSVGVIESYGRSSGLHYPLNLYGTAITLTAAPGGERLTVDSGGFAFMGREATYGTGLINYGVSMSGGGVTQLWADDGSGGIAPGQTTTSTLNNVREVLRSLLRTLHKKGILTITDFVP